MQRLERGSACVLAAVCALIGACSSGPDLTAVDAATADPPGAATASPMEQAALERGLAPLALDADGRPRLLRAVRPIPSAARSPEAAARAHLGALSSVWDLDARAAAELEVRAVHPLRGGARIVTLRQRAGGVDIDGGELRVLLDRDLALRAVSGTRLAADRAPRAAAFAIDGAAALRVAATDRFGAGAAVGPSQERRVLYRLGDDLRAAWSVEVYGARGGNDAELWRVIVDATSGAVLERTSRTHDAEFAYRVFADATAEGRPWDGPQESYLPHPTGSPTGAQPAFAAPNLVTIDGFNATGDPWIAAGATVSTGNNVDAYVDLDDSQDGFTAGTDFRASTTAPGTFDRTYDTALGPLANQTQQMAATTQLFYVINWLHDWWYDSGFTEAAGNAQTDNYGRGGAGGDAILAEAQDDANGTSRNNANMSTPSDGLPPKMQMYLWSGYASHSVTANPGNVSFANGTAAFGPQSFDVTAELALAVDATAPVNDACTAIASVTGKIALVDRGNCNFDVKAQNVQNAGGVGMLLANNTVGTVDMAGNGAALPPSLSVSQADGNTLKTMLGSGTVTVRLVRSAAGPERDGDLDGTIVAHEWGHYLHHRLASCGAQQCGAMSEGWGDFNALHALVTPTDDPQGAYPIAIYSYAFGADAYFGLRRAPYSTDFTKNGFTFQHIQASATLPTTFPIAFGGSNNEVHNAGEVWAAMMWEAYVGLIDDMGYTYARRAISDYVVAGLLLTPPDATFTEARDAILAAAAAIDTSDAVAIAEAFARRGAGSCAVSPPSSSTTLDGVVESFTVSGELAVGAVTVDDDVTSCDDDGILDAGESGTISVEIVNGGAGTLAATTIAVSSTTSGVTIGGAPSVPSIPPFSSVTVGVPVSLASSVTGRVTIALSIELDDSGACNGGVTGAASIRANYDSVPASSATDDVESDATLWTRTGTDAADVWSRQSVAGQTIVWHGNDLAAPSDTQLVSPPLPVGTGAFSVSFQHRFSFEYSSGPPTYWDGGVVELSTNDGATWADVSTFGATSGYTGTLSTAAGNPLGGRLAYGRTNAAYPSRNTVTLAFGTQLANQTVRLRFRIGTDEAAGDYGWDIDDLAVTGITTTPFATLADEAGACDPTSPDAGVPPDASTPPPDAATTPPDAEPDAAPVPPDAAPVPPDAEPLPDDGAVEHDAAPTPGDDDDPGGGGDGGCGCRSAGDPAGALAPLLAVALLLLLRRPRALVRTSTSRRSSRNRRAASWSRDR